MGVKCQIKYGFIVENKTNVKSKNFIIEERDGAIDMYDTEKKILVQLPYVALRDFIAECEEVKKK
jgi:hypothetical protein